MRRKILPLLDEYFFDDWRALRKALGDVDENNDEVGPLFVTSDPAPALGVRNAALFKWNHVALSQPDAYTKLYAGPNPRADQAGAQG